MSPLLWAVLGAVIRTGAAALSGYLITHHVLTADKADTFTNEVTTHVLMALPIVSALAWSIVQKYLQHAKLSKATDQVADMKAAQQRIGV